MTGSTRTVSADDHQCPDMGLLTFPLSVIADRFGHVRSLVTMAGYVPDRDVEILAVGSGAPMTAAVKQGKVEMEEALRAALKGGGAYACCGPMRILHAEQGPAQVLAPAFASSRTLQCPPWPLHGVRGGPQPE